jgi:hypothetical protein
LLVNEATPHLVGLPDGVQVAFRLGEGSALTQHAIKKYKRGNAHVGGAMNKYRPLTESFHHPAKSPEIL